ncbi:MAG: sigma 54-interacting transcriptional regulator [Candidatus Zixiibacteriota bacterium]|nr:MAG: sigma 54-interacting transcriptional regulator [candidate division Zixibacteria bacterium]
MNGVGICQSIRHYMTSLIDHKKFAEAVQYFEAHAKELERAGEPGAGEVIHLAAKAYASLTHLSNALKVARTAQHLVSEEGDSVLLAEIFLTIGGILRDMSEFKEAEKAYRDAESIFRRNDCPEGQSRALNQLAGLFFRQTDYNNSLAALMDAIEIARTLDDRQKLAYMIGNVGRLQTFTGDLSEAEKNLRLNIELSRELGDALEQARAYLSLGYVYLQKADFVRAEEALDQAYPLVVQTESKRDEVIYLTYLGELLYRSGRVNDGRATLEKALGLSLETAPGGDLEARASRHLAEVFVLMKDYRGAARMCARSWVLTEKADDKVELGALCRIKAVIAEARRRGSEARKQYVRAIELLGESGVRFEKAEALVAAGQSQLFPPRQRLTYLFRAEEIFTRYGMSTRRRQVERLIDENDYGKSSRIGRAGEPEEFPGDVDYHTRCREIKQFKGQLPLIANSDLPILLTGETGVGKDHLARYFQHVARPRSPFVAINCASLPESLLESELFGYSRGAFTGADKNKQGLFVAANGGVLFLDEIGDLPLNLQTKLLGVLENHRVIPLGSTQAVILDIKLVAATNRNLEQMVEDGSFRRDLYYRLSGISFEIPPLRRRKEDIPLLLEHFMKSSGLTNGDANALPPELVRQFVSYDWPGNTRELLNKVKRLEVMAQMVAEGDLVELARSMFSSDAPRTSSSLFDRVEEFERKIIMEALLAARGNKSEVARMLGIHEATVRTKLKRYGIDTGRYS